MHGATAFLNVFNISVRPSDGITMHGRGREDSIEHNFREAEKANICLERRDKEQGAIRDKEKSFQNDGTNQSRSPVASFLPGRGIGSPPPGIRSARVCPRPGHHLK